MQVFSDTTEPAQFLLSIYRQILLIDSNFCRQFTGIEY